MWGRGSPSSCARRHTCSSTTRGRRSRSGRDAGELAVLPYLRYRGVRHVDALVVSHGDLDHRGGANSVLAGDAGRASSGGAVGRHRCRAQRALPARATLDLGRRAVRDAASGALRLARATTTRPASCSCAAAPAACCSPGTWKQPPSRKSSTVGCRARPSSSCLITAAARPRRAPFVAASRPALALVSAGYRNRWGLPRREVVERWRAAGARVLTTADSGAIEITFAAGRPPLAREYRRDAAPLLASLTVGAPLSATMTRITRPIPDIHVRTLMFEIVKAGGPMMGPIILASIVAAAIILERLWTLQTKRVLPAELTDKVWRWVEQGQIQDKHIAALRAEFAARQSARRRSRQSPSRPRDPQGGHRGHRAPRRARARSLHRHARHDRVAVAADGTARHGDGHDPHVQRDHDRRHRQSDGAGRRHRRGADHDRGRPGRRDPGDDRLPVAARPRRAAGRGDGKGSDEAGAGDRAAARRPRPGGSQAGSRGAAA